MAIKLTVDSFLKLVRQSNLIPQERLKQVVGELREAGVNVENSRMLADEMVARDILTRWQAEKLLQGKHKGFFLGKYRLLSLLGKGGMSSVYLAEHVLMRRRCAIKVLPGKRVNDTSYLGRFHREAQAVAALDHPNIVRAYDVDHETENDNEIHFLVMEYVEGRSLQEIVDQDGVLGYVTAAEYMRQSASGLAHAHAAGMVHRDIKPANLLVDKSGTVRLLDLGLARFFDDGDEVSLTVAHDEKVLGTADYLAPEQALDSHSVDRRADIYSLGCTFYFVLTGHPPFVEGTLAQRLMAHQKKKPPSITVDRPDVPTDLLTIIEKMMAKEVEDRHQTTEQVMQDLTEWLVHHGDDAWRQKYPGLSGSGKRAPRNGDESAASTETTPPTATPAVAVPVVRPVQPTATEEADKNTPAPVAATEGLPAELPTEAEPPNEHERSLSHFLANLGQATEEEPAAPATPTPAPVGAEVPPEPALPASAKPVTNVAPPAAKLARGVDEGGSGKPAVARPAEPAAPTAKPVKPATPVKPAAPVTEVAETPKAKPAAPVEAVAVAEPPTSPFTPTEEPEPSPFGFRVDESRSPVVRRTTRRDTSRKSARSGALAKLLENKKLLGIGAVVLAGLIGVAVFAFTRGPDDEPAGPESLPTPTAGKKPESPTPETPAEPSKQLIGQTILVGGPDAHFQTINAALDYVKQNFDPKPGSATQVIQVASGQKFPERIALDNSDFSVPKGIRLRTDPQNPAVLNPSGSEPVVNLASLEDFQLEGFRIEAGGAPRAVRLANLLFGVRLRSLDISGYAEAGIAGDGAKGDSRGNQDVVLENLTFHGTAGSVGLKLDPSAFGFGSPATWYVIVRGCRFLGPHAAGAAVGSNALGVRITESLFAGEGNGVGVRVESQQAEHNGVFIGNCTFYNLQSGIVFTGTPKPPVDRPAYALRRNLFAQVSGPQVALQSGDAGKFIADFLPGEGIALNHTTATQADGANALNVFSQSGGQLGVKAEFVSTNASDAKFLSPKPNSLPKNTQNPLSKIGKFSIGLKPYVGALRP